MSTSKDAYQAGRGRESRDSQVGEYWACAPWGRGAMKAQRPTSRGSGRDVMGASRTAADLFQLALNAYKRMLKKEC